MLCLQWVVVINAGSCDFIMVFSFFIAFRFLTMSPLLLRYFSTSVADASTSCRQFSIAALRFLRNNGDLLHKVILLLDENAHLVSVLPLTNEVAATVWHRGTLVELPNGEIVQGES